MPSTKLNEIVAFLLHLTHFRSTLLEKSFIVSVVKAFLVPVITTDTI
jgi:hypothetical protein